MQAREFSALGPRESIQKMWNNSRMQKRSATRFALHTAESHVNKNILSKKWINQAKYLNLSEKVADQSNASEFSWEKEGNKRHFRRGLIHCMECQLTSFQLKKKWMVRQLAQSYFQITILVDTRTSGGRRR